MARLAIGKGFLTEYGRLDKDVQGAVDAAIAKFAKHPHPGSHLEKPQRSWDDRIRTLEVDNRWRGIVLAPMTGDTYCLVTILPKDKAKAYATSHRFSVNPALGVLEVRDEEAIQRLRRQLQEAVKPTDKRLFADVTDADLARLGVDAQMLPMIRLMTSEADLETRQTALPEAQYAALHALACGMTLDEAREEVGRLYSAGPPPERVDPDDLVSAMERSPGQVSFVSGHEELRLILAHPFAAWRMFLHPSQRKIAYRTSYSGPAQVTGGPGTGKTVTLLHRAAFLAARSVRRPASEPGAEGRQPPWPDPDDGQVLVTTFNGTLADALGTQLDLLIKDDRARRLIEVLNVDRLAYRIVKEARGAPVIADERVLRSQWAKAAATAGLDFTPAFLKNEWEQVILAQDLHTEQAYLTCLRTGRGRPLTKLQRSQIWQAAQQVSAELAAARQSTHLQLANEATHLLRQPGAPRYRHILVDEAQDLHPSQWRLLRAAVPPGPDDLFIVADPHQRIYDNRVSLASMRISVRGRSQRLSLSYRTTQEVLSWAVSLLGTEPVTGLDGEVDSLLGYRSPMHGPQPRLRVTETRAEEFGQLAEQIRSWLALGIEPQAIGVTARSASLVREAREMLKAEGIVTVPLSGRHTAEAVRAGTMHAMKGLEFQAVAVIGVERGLVPEPATITPESEDPAAHVQDLQRERCVLFVACTRARDHLYVSGTGQPSTFLTDCEPDPAAPGRDSAAPAGQGESLSPVTAAPPRSACGNCSGRARTLGARGSGVPPSSRKRTFVLTTPARSRWSSAGSTPACRSPGPKATRCCRAGLPAWPRRWPAWPRPTTRAKPTGTRCGRPLVSTGRQKTRASGVARSTPRSAASGWRCSQNFPCPPPGRSCCTPACPATAWVTSSGCCSPAVGLIPGRTRRVFSPGRRRPAARRGWLSWASPPGASCSTGATTPTTWWTGRSTCLTGSPSESPTSPASGCPVTWSKRRRPNSPTGILTSPGGRRRAGVQGARAHRAAGEAADRARPLRAGRARAVAGRRGNAGRRRVLADHR